MTNKVKNMTNKVSNKKTKLVVKKMFRLIDIRVYDDQISNDVELDEDDQTYKPFTDDKIFMIQMFGINEIGETCCIYINDYKPFFYVRVGDDWTYSKVNTLIQEMKSKVPKMYNDSIVSYKLVDRHKLYGFSAGHMHKFVQIVFNNSISLSKYKSLWYSYKDNSKTAEKRRIRTNLRILNTDIELYESNIPPILRYFHINNISPSGWISIIPSKVIKVVEKTTTCKYEYISSYKQITPMPEKETSVPYKICSFDIEASSSHGDFPLPVKTYKRLAMNMVEIFTKQNKVITENMQQLLFQKMILAAFGYCKLEDIDLVYPKVNPSKSKIQLKIDKLISKPLENAKKEVDEDNSDLIKIDEIFESINETYQNTDGSENATGEEMDEIIENNYSNKNKKGVIIKKNNTIIDILNDEQINNDEKIKILDDALTLIFPRLKGDEVTFIGSTFLNYGSKDPYLNHCLVVGSCDAVDGAVIDTVKTERELLLKWTELIKKEDPDIIIGYNIFGFDYEFMFRRAQENNCDREFLLLSRKINEICANQDKEDIGKYNLEHTKIQIASGEYDLRYAKMTGRLQIDMYAYFRRDFNLTSYKLDDVAGHFISDSISKTQTRIINGKQVTELYSKNLLGLQKNDFIHIEIIGFTTDYYNDGEKFKVLDIELNREETIQKDGKETTIINNVIILEGAYDIPIDKKIRWGMAKDDVSPQDIFRLTKGSATDRAVVAKYCIQDCNIVHHLMNKIDVITGYIEMSRICSVPIDYLVFRGQGIKLTSFVAKKCREKNTLMPDIEKPTNADGYEGAIVLPPKCAMYMDKPVACVDYASLYPSSMISQNFSHDSKVWTKEYDLNGNLIQISGEQNDFGKFIYDNLPEYQYVDIEFDTYKYLRDPSKPTSKAVKTKVGKMKCRWAQFPDNKKGIMPSILEELLKARKDTRKMIKTEKDPFMQNILDKRQLGYKVTANSLYGQCGSRTSTFYEKDVAASTTASGRMMIIYARRIIEEVYSNRIYKTLNYGNVKCNAEYVYGDTDSVFFTFNLEDPETGIEIRGKKALEITIEIAQDAAELSSKYLKPPMKLEYEKTLMPFILLSKKRYVGMLYEEDPNKGYMKFMGLSIKRRDSCDYLKDVYGGILNILMHDNNISKAIEFLQQSLNSLISGKVSMDKLTITKALRGYYKNPMQIGHRVLADRIGQRDPGNKPRPGDRMKFVFIVTKSNKVLMGDKIETPEYIVENNLKIDYTHYITNQLMKPLQQLFGLALEDIWNLQNKKIAIKNYQTDIKNMKAECTDVELFMKKKEKYCSNKVKVLLFDKTLNQIYNEQHGIQMITSFFKK